MPKLIQSLVSLMAAIALVALFIFVPYNVGTMATNIFKVAGLKIESGKVIAVYRWSAGGLVLIGILVLGSILFVLSYVVRSFLFTSPNDNCQPDDCYDPWD